MAGSNGAETKGRGCRICGGELTKGTLKAGNSEANIVIAGKPDGFLGVIPYTTSQISARVCTSCGHIDLYARNLQDILKVEAGD